MRAVLIAAIALIAAAGPASNAPPAFRELGDEAARTLTTRCPTS